MVVGREVSSTDSGGGEEVDAADMSMNGRRRPSGRGNAGAEGEGGGSCFSISLESFLVFI